MKHMIILCMAVLLGASLIGCETTGDPSKGGLLGWSKAKADARIVDLKVKAAEQSAIANQEKENSDTLNKDYDQSVNDLVAQQKALENLLIENQTLSDKLSLLATKQSRYSQQRKELQKERDKLIREMEDSGDSVYNDMNVNVDFQKKIADLNQYYIDTILLMSE